MADKAWTYKVTLPEVEEAKHSTVHFLAFDGLDTFATVKLNGGVILESDNMFIPHRVDVTKQLKAGRRTSSRLTSNQHGWRPSKFAKRIRNIRGSGSMAICRDLRSEKHSTTGAGTGDQY